MNMEEGTINERVSDFWDVHPNLLNGVHTKSSNANDLPNQHQN